MGKVLFLAGLITFAVGITLLLAGTIVGWGVMPGVIDNAIEDEVQLNPDLDVWDKWIDISLPIHFSFYFFNITNPDEVMSGKAPKLQEVGPYVYTEKRTKFNVTQEHSEYTVQYHQKIEYFFDKELSGNHKWREDDVIIILNVPMISFILGLYQRIAESQGHDFAVTSVNNVMFYYLNDEQIVRAVTVKEATFEGFDVQNYVDTGLQLPDEFEGGLFGFYKGRNGTDDGEYDIFTGVHNSTQFGQIRTWQGEKELGFWEPHTKCDEVRGTDGSIFAPFLDEDSVIEIFSSDICRSLRFTYLEDIDYDGVKGLRFTLPPEVLQDPRHNLDNRCYCTEKDVENCPKAGAIHLGGCRSGAPIVMSTPYFLDGDSEYREAAGLGSPSRDLHETRMDIEPNTGALLEAQKKIQINYDVIKIPGITKMEKLTEIMHPLFWIHENAFMDEDTLDDLKDTLSPIKLVNILRWVVVAIAIVAVLVGAFFTYKSRAAKKTNE